MQEVVHSWKLHLTQQEQIEPDEPKSEPVFNIAPVVVALFAACVATHFIRVYLLTPDQDFALLLHTAFIPIRYSNLSGVDFYAVTSTVTYSLIHGSWIHLAINMIWLAAFGSPLANRIGTARFVLFWVFTSIAAVALHGVLHQGDAMMVIGASGAVSGMMAAAARFGFRVDRSTKRSAFSGRMLSIQAVFRNRMAVVFLGVWFVVNLIAGLGYLMPGDAAPIAWEAHIGGFLAGFFGLGLFDRRRVVLHF